MEIRQVNIDKLFPYCHNPRKNDHAVERMVASIQGFGFKIPVLARSNGEVIDGHLRLKAAQKLGMTEVPVILCDEWSEAQVKAFRLLANRSVNWAEWDLELVAFEIQGLKALDFDLTLTGFDPVEIDGFLFGDTDEQSSDVASEVPQTAVTQLGNLWLCDSHRILCCDATSSPAVAGVSGVSWRCRLHMARRGARSRSGGGAGSSGVPHSGADHLGQTALCAEPRGLPLETRALLVRRPRRQVVELVR